ncbi:MAG: hypothetical protein IPP44_03845 [Ideonella sp.]|nr:hypothetical protein [Ideonella sp.]
MKLEQIPYGQIESLRLRWTSASGALPNAAAPGAEALLQFSEREAQATLRIGGEVLGVQGDGRKHEVLLLGPLHAALPRVAWVVDAGPQRSPFQVHTFLHALRCRRSSSASTRRSSRRLSASTESSPRLSVRWSGWTSSSCSMERTAGVGSRRPSPRPARSRSLAERRAFIRRVKRSDSTEGLLVDRVARGRGQGGEQLALVSGDVRFVDATVAGKLRADAAAQLSTLVTSGSSFLDLWSRYGAMENEAALRRARKARWIKYDHVESLPEGRYRFSMANDCTLDDARLFKQTLAEEHGLSVEAVNEVPEVLTREMSWSEYEAQLARRTHRRPRPSMRGWSFTSGTVPSP